MTEYLFSSKEEDAGRQGHPSEASGKMDSMTDEPDYLDNLYGELNEKYKATYGPKVEAAQRRRAAIRRVSGEVAVQSLSTVIGGAALAGGAVALGWINTDPSMRASAGAGAVILVFLLILGLRTASRPLDTRDDNELADRLRMVEQLMAERDSQPSKKYPEGPGHTDE